jgi:drug/metabolite transporter (DMT)-like permease
MAVLRGAALPVALALVWGANWPAMKLAIEAGIGPLWLAASRFAVGAACLAPVLLARHHALVPRSRDVPVVLGGALGPMAVFTVLAGLALTVLPAGPSAVVAYATPLWVVPAAWLALGERPTGRTLAAAALGVIGLLVLSGPWALDWTDPRVLFGQAALLLASAAWAASIVQVRARGGVFATPLLTIVFWQLVIAAAILLPVAALLEPAPASAAIWSALPAVTYVGVAGTALAFLLMLDINRRLSATAMAMATLGVPVAGVLLSWTLLDERPSVAVCAGAALVLVAVAISATSAKPIPRGTGDTP